MSVPLEPPLTRSTVVGHAITWGQPLTTGPRYVRTPGMSRWHRPRHGVRYPRGVSYGLWCGQAARDDGRLLTADQPPAGDAVCGTCEGRAIGAGQDTQPDGRPPLLFSPARLVPPKKCPGSRTVWCEELAWNVGRCLACGAICPMRSSGGPYNPRWGLTTHPPGPDLVAGCPFHAWRELGVQDGRVSCRCTHNLGGPA